MDYGMASLALHAQLRGKWEISSRCPIDSREQLSLAYTPGVAEPCLAIQRDRAQSFALTRRWNTVAVVTDGSAVLGLGDIGPEAAMPVMEGKCILFKEFADVDAIPLCLRTQDVDQIVETVALLAGSFGGINLEDIAAPRCFEIERRLKERCDIPVFHDDQHGTAVVVLAALINALRLTGRQAQELRVVLSGAGAAACAVARLLLSYGVEDITLCDINGALYAGRMDVSPELADLLAQSNRRQLRGSLPELLPGADVLIGLSAPNLLTAEHIHSMNPQPIVFALANPTPEIFPDQARAGGAQIVATGRSDFPNQINNLLAFPGIFRGALDARASDINQEMKLAAAHALAEALPVDRLSNEQLLPDPLQKGVAAIVAEAVVEAAKSSGVARG